MPPAHHGSPYVPATSTLPLPDAATLDHDMLALPPELHDWPSSVETHSRP
jgi:hypothetical protein